jgi:hypothetical protein
MTADTLWTDYLITQAVALRSRIVAYPHCAPLLVRYTPRDNMFGEYEQMCQFRSDSGVPARLHVRIVDGPTALTLGSAILGENAADYADSGAGPRPDPASHPALRQALDAIEGVNADELFGTYLRTYLDGICARSRIPHRPALPGGRGLLRPRRTVPKPEARLTIGCWTSDNDFRAAHVLTSKRPADTHKAWWLPSTPVNEAVSVWESPWMGMLR